MKKKSQLLNSKSRCPPFLSPTSSKAIFRKKSPSVNVTSASSTLVENLKKHRNVESKLKCISEMDSEVFTLTKKELISLIQLFAAGKTFETSSTISLLKEQKRSLEVLHTLTMPENIYNMNPLRELTRQSFSSFENIAVMPSYCLQNQTLINKRLLQKELILDKVIEVVARDGVDPKKLLFTTYEGILSDNYFSEDPNLLLEGSFVYEDKINSGWIKLDSKTKEYLHLSLEDIADLQHSSSQV